MIKLVTDESRLNEAFERARAAIRVFSYRVWLLTPYSKIAIFNTLWILMIPWLLFLLAPSLPMLCAMPVLVYLYFKIAVREAQRLETYSE